MIRIAAKLIDSGSAWRLKGGNRRRGQPECAVCRLVGDLDAADDHTIAARRICLTLKIVSQYHLQHRSIGS